MKSYGSPKGGWFHVADDLGRNDFTDEQGVRDDFWSPGDGQMVVDVGAAIGSYALPALARGACVVAFDPDRAQRKALEANVLANQGFAERFIVQPVGLFSKSGWLTEYPDKYVWSETKPDTAVHFPVTSLDSYGLERVDWIKVDVEGHEVQVLAGAAETIVRCKPRLLIECHQFMRSTLADEVEAFVLGLGLGYHGVRRPHHSVVHAFYEVK
jgi:FkbM family methyltransferase